MLPIFYVIIFLFNYLYPIPPNSIVLDKLKLHTLYPTASRYLVLYSIKKFVPTLYLLII